MQEAEELYVWVQDDRKQLEKAGLDWNIIEDLPNRTALCRETQTMWNTYRLAQTETRKRLNLLVERARTMKNNLIHALYVATKFDRGEREIRAGKGISDNEAKSRMKKWQR